MVTLGVLSFLVLSALAGIGLVALVFSGLALILGLRSQRAKVEAAKAVVSNLLGARQPTPVRPTAVRPGAERRP